VTKLPLIVTLALAMLASSHAVAADQTVALAVENMDCAACPHIVKASLQAIPGVKQAIVSYAAKSVLVTYDDAKTDVKALVAATTNAGYPSVPKG
jgi:mercuric ion binding protein